MIKLITIVGTRPELIRLSETIKKCDKYFDHTLVNTFQNFDYELNEIFFNDLKIRKPDFNFYVDAKTPSKIIANVIDKTDMIIRKIKPDAFLILGDTNSSLSAISAKKNNIPIFHIEAGNRSFDAEVPEEINRKIVDHISDINITYSHYAKQNLISEGLANNKIIKLGSPLDEVINKNLKKINSSKILKKYQLKKNKYFLVSYHRDENLKSSKRTNQLFANLKKLSQIFKIPIIISTHPKTKKLYEKNLKKLDGIIFSKPFCFTDYVKLQINAKVVLSDSGSLLEESSILDFKALILRKSFERQESLETGNALMSDFDIENLIATIKILDDNRLSNKMVQDYQNKDFSTSLCKIIYSYTNIIKKNINL